MIEAIPPRVILAVFTRARRMHEGLTQAALAAAIGVTARQVCAAEAGRGCGGARLALERWNEIAKMEQGDA